MLFLRYFSWSKMVICRSRGRLAPKLSKRDLLLVPWEEDLHFNIYLKLHVTFGHRQKGPSLWPNPLCQTHNKFLFSQKLHLSPHCSLSLITTKITPAQYIMVHIVPDLHSPHYNLETPPLGTGSDDDAIGEKDWDFYFSRTDDDSNGDIEYAPPLQMAAKIVPTELREIWTLATKLSLTTVKGWVEIYWETYFVVMVTVRVCRTM